MQLPLGLRRRIRYISPRTWHFHRPSVFSIFYSTSFTILFIITLALLLLTPGDAILQSYHNKQVVNIIIVAGVYIATFIIALLIYASRLFTNRQIIANIPKAYIPIEEEDIGKNVRNLIVDGLKRSALIAYEVRPRDLRDEKEWRSQLPSAENSRASSTRPSSDRRDDARQSGPKQPPWGEIYHPGWSSPSSVDLPNVHFDDVVRELPHLIEATAVSLAPPSAEKPLQSRMGSTTSVRRHVQQSFSPDAGIVSLLKRSPNMGLREYLTHLIELDLIDPPEMAEEFLAIYEMARYSTKELDEQEFRKLMAIFAEIMASLKELPPSLLNGIDEMNEADNDAGDDYSIISRTTSELHGADSADRDIAHMSSKARGKMREVSTEMSRASTSSSSITASSDEDSLHTAPLYHQPSNASILNSPGHSSRKFSGSSLRLAAHSPTLSPNLSPAHSPMRSPRDLLHSPSGRSFRNQLRNTSQARPLLGGRTVSGQSLDPPHTANTATSTATSGANSRNDNGSPGRVPYTIHMRRSERSLKELSNGFTYRDV